ncbi:MAG: hypothetical protein ACYDCC_08840 [Actinomycetota bacterium]
MSFRSACGIALGAALLASVAPAAQAAPPPGVGVAVIVAYVNESTWIQGGLTYQVDFQRGIQAETSVDNPVSLGDSDYQLELKIIDGAGNLIESGHGQATIDVIDPTMTVGKASGTIPTNLGSASIDVTVACLPLVYPMQIDPTHIDPNSIQNGGQPWGWIDPYVYQIYTSGGVGSIYYRFNCTALGTVQSTSGNGFANKTSANSFGFVEPIVFVPGAP